MNTVDTLDRLISLILQFDLIFYANFSFLKVLAHLPMTA